MEKTSKITSCTFKREWAGDKGTVYYHDVVLENGDAGSIGAKVKDSPELQPGKDLSYTIEYKDYNGKPDNKIKAVRAQTSGGGGGKSQPKDEARITWLSCLSSACTLHAQKLIDDDAVIATAQRFYNASLSKTSFK